MVFHWSLSDSKSPQVSRTRLGILAVLSNAVIWIVSTRPLTSKSSRPFNNPLVIVPKAPITNYYYYYCYYYYYYYSFRVFHISVYYYYYYYLAEPHVSDDIMVNTNIEILLISKHYFEMVFRDEFKEFGKLK